MRSIEWTERMSVGVPLLDADHKIFIDIINELEHCARYPDRRDAARDALGRLVEYARYHFEREEKVMAACGYPGIDDHHHEPEKFAQYMGEVALRFGTDRDAAPVANRLAQALNQVTQRDRSVGPEVDNVALVDILHELEAGTLGGEFHDDRNWFAGACRAETESGGNCQRARSDRHHQQIHYCSSSTDFICLTPLRRRRRPG